MLSKENNWTRPDMIDIGDLVIMRPEQCALGDELDSVEDTQTNINSFNCTGTNFDLKHLVVPE